MLGLGVSKVVGVDEVVPGNPGEGRLVVAQVKFTTEEKKIAFISSVWRMSTSFIASLCPLYMQSGISFHNLIEEFYLTNPLILRAVSNTVPAPRH